MSSDDDFDDSDLNGQAMIEALDRTERSFAISYPSSSQANDTWAGMDVPHGIKTVSPHLETEPDFTDPIIMAALNNAESRVINTRVNTNTQDEVITLTRAQLELIKRNTFIAGRRTLQTDQRPFTFLALPAELRLIFYKVYFSDRNPVTAGYQASALPNRLSDAQHCCSSNHTWCKTVRPWVSTNILLTCKQIYLEARDDFLYKNRRFKASVGRLNLEFKVIGPHLRFWQYIQHMDLQVTPEANRGARYETGNLILHLVALLKGGQNLRSFKLKYGATGREESITRFKDLRVRGSVSLTQIFRDWFEPDEKEDLRRKEQLERLLFSICGCAPFDAPPYDFITSTKEMAMDVVNLQLDVPSFETYYTITTEFD